ncbi:hypothetical protein D3C78_1249780 [compost metagenome]
MFRYVETGYLFRSILASMQSKAARMREAFQHSCSVPIRERHFLAIPIYRNGSAIAFGISNLLQDDSASLSPTGHQRFNRSAVLALIKEIARFLALLNINLYL